MCVLSVPFPALVHSSWLGIAHLPQTGFGMAGDRSNTTAAVPGCVLYLQQAKDSVYRPASRLRSAGDPCCLNLRASEAID